MQLTNAFIVLSALLTSVSASSGFGLTCSDIHLDGQNIVATCLNEGGGNNGAQALGLNSCLINNNGEFACQFNGGGLNSCNDCSLGGTVITCNCFRANGGTDTSSFDLNTCIGNNDGVLVCP
ncbi:Cyanovirin-N [Auricularia subglabra TFB-10046 SS5]|nr:Cyanovirin-N [Auricularia subglabra TFB-10046 SS5]